MMRTGEWAGATPMHFAAAHAVMHEEVYGVAVEESRQKSWWLKSAGAAKRLLAGTFGGDAEELATYVRWLWTREAEKLRWAEREKIVLRKRLSVWAAYSPSLVTDWRFSLERKSRVPR